MAKNPRPIPRPISIKSAEYSRTVSAREPDDIVMALLQISKRITEQVGYPIKPGTVISLIIHRGLPALCKRYGVPLPGSLSDRQDKIL